MASSSSEKGFDSSPAEVMKTMARCTDGCHGCLRSRTNLGVASFMRCVACRSVLYCSSACQVAHWKAEHKKVCKKRAKDRAVSREAAAGPKFVDEFDQWTQSSQLLLDHMIIMMMYDALASAARRGACVQAAELTRDFCVVINADYRPGSRLPFQIRDDYKLLSFEDVLRRGSVGNSKFQVVAKELRSAWERQKLTSNGGRLVLNTFVTAGGAGGVTKLLMTWVPPATFNGIIGEADLLGNTVAAVVSNINEGLGGTGTTKSSRRIRR